MTTLRSCMYVVVFGLHAELQKPYQLISKTCWQNLPVITDYWLHVSQDNNASVFSAKGITHLQSRTKWTLSFLFLSRVIGWKRIERRRRALTFVIDYDDGEHVILSQHGEVYVLGGPLRLAEIHSRPKCPVHLHTLTRKPGTRSHARQITGLPFFCSSLFS